MATIPNQKPVPSEDYVNMRFNAGKFDEFMTSTASSYVDRLGITHLTVKGIQASVTGALLSANNLSDVQSAATSRTNLGATTIGSQLFTATSAANARTAILAAVLGANSDITSLTGLTTPLSTAQGGTGATTAAAARTSLGAAASAGVANASSAAAGVVGEVLSNTGTLTAITTGTIQNTATLVLSPGDWDVKGVINIESSSASFTSITAGISGASGTINVFPNRTQIVTAFSSSGQHVPVPSRRFNVSVTTTIYLAASCSFASGTAQAQGYLEARRMR